MTSHVSKRKRSKPKALPDFNPLAMERTMSELRRILGQQEFGSIEEANAFLQNAIGAKFDKALENLPAPSPQEEAQDLAWRAMQARSRKEAVALATEALSKDPDCVDALLILAHADAKNPEDVIAGLEKAVAAGERSLGAEFFAENKGHFWGILETRPYMRARLELAGLLRFADRTNEAIGHYEAILELNPNDNQGIRDPLLGCYLATDNLEGARRLLRDYEGDAGTVFAWGKVLERFLSRDYLGAERALRNARRGNRFVEEYFTGKKKVPEGLPGMYSLGSREEALVCCDCLLEAWVIRHLEAAAWLMIQVEGAKAFERAKPRR